MDAYRDSVSGLGGESEPLEGPYLLRPEFVETLFYLHRLTSDSQYKKAALRVWDALLRHCLVESGGFSGLQSVSRPSQGRVDEQPSFFIAETLLYLVRETRV